MYSIIYAHHSTAQYKGNKTQSSRALRIRQHMVVQPPQAHNHGKYDNNETGWYVRFDYDNKMGYEYMVLTT